MYHKVCFELSWFFSKTGSVGGAENEDGSHPEWEVHQHTERHRQNDDRLREDEERPHKGTRLANRSTIYKEFIPFLINN